MEAEWVDCIDPLAMVEFLRGNPTSSDSVTWWNSRWRTGDVSRGDERKYLLFSCACCRRIWVQIPEACNQRAVIAVEDFLEGHISGSMLEEAFVASSAVEWLEDGSRRRPEPGYWAVKYLGRGFYKMTPAASALVVASKVIFMADEEYGEEASRAFNACFYTGEGFFLSPFRWPIPEPDTVVAERAAQADLLRCLFGNPFRHLTFDSTWVTSNVIDLARTIYDERDFEKMIFLADSLERSGCPASEILDHCREPGHHARGCWVLDSILGKS